MSEEEAAPLIDYPGLVSQARERIKTLEVNLEHLLDRVAEQKRACKACGVMLWMVRHQNGRIGPYTVDGTNHFVNCTDAARFRGAGATQ